MTEGRSDARRHLMADEPDEKEHLSKREAMAKGMGGGWPGYLHRLREGHVPTFGEGRYVTEVYTGCSCGVGLCPVPHLLAHIDDCIAAYEAKVQDLAAESLRATAWRDACRWAVPGLSDVDKLRILAGEPWAPPDVLPLLAEAIEARGWSR